MASILITGSNRGLGLEWARHYAQRDWQVFATCRYPEQANTLRQLAASHDNLHIKRLDVTDPHETRNLAKNLKDQPIDVVINNAGVYFEHWGKDPVGSINYDDWARTFNVNSLGAMRVTEALVESIADSDRRLVVAISSHMGSIADITQPRDYAYRSSKAALNAAMKGLSLELQPRGIGVLLLHPGWVRTRMGGNDAPLSAEESVAGMSRLIENYTSAMSGRFFRYDSSEIPW